MLKGKKSNSLGQENVSIRSIAPSLFSHLVPTNSKKERPELLAQARQSKAKSNDLEISTADPFGPGKTSKASVIAKLTEKLYLGPSRLSGHVLYILRRTLFVLRKKTVLIISDHFMGRTFFINSWFY